MHTSRYVTQCEVLMYYHEFRFLEQLEKTVGVVVQILRKCRLRLAVAIERRLRQRRRRASHLYDTHTHTHASTSVNDVTSLLVMVYY